MRLLKSKKDTAFLVDVFYEKVLQDEMLAPFFMKLNFETHKPRMVHFWNFVLFDEEGFTTNVTNVHTSMPIEKEHFDRWVLLFNQTVDAHFSGENAEKAKQRAALIAWSINSKMN